MEDQQESWLGQVLGCDRDGHLAATEHKAGIEWVTGYRLDLGMSLDLGINRNLSTCY